VQTSLILLSKLNTHQSWIITLEGIFLYKPIKKEEKEVLSKLTLLKAASQRLENALNYDFEHVGEYYSESLFGAMKLDRKVIGDMDTVEDYLHERWKRTGRLLSTQDFVNCLCVSLWRLFKQLSQKEEENNKNKSIEEETTSSEEVTLKSLEILKLSPVKDKQISKIQSILQDIQKK